MKKRKLNRLPGHDYSTTGYYFVTICTKKRIECLGKIENSQIGLNKYGEIVKKYIRQIPNIHQNSKIDIFQIMPNHIHMVILILSNSDADNVGTGQCPVPTNKDSRSYGKLSKIINGLKGVTCKQIRQNKFPDFQWQRSFYDRIIRNEEELNKIRKYIDLNPLIWDRDRNNPKNFIKP